MGQTKWDWALRQVAKPSWSEPARIPRSCVSHLAKSARGLRKTDCLPHRGSVTLPLTGALKTKWLLARPPIWNACLKTTTKRGYRGSFRLRTLQARRRSIDRSQMPAFQLRRSSSSRMRSISKWNNWERDPLQWNLLILSSHSDRCLPE